MRLGLGLGLLTPWIKTVFPSVIVRSTRLCFSGTENDHIGRRYQLHPLPQTWIPIFYTCAYDRFFYTRLFNQLEMRQSTSVTVNPDDEAPPWHHLL